MKILGEYRVYFARALALVAVSILLFGCTEKKAAPEQGNGLRPRTPISCLAVFIPSFISMLRNLMQRPSGCGRETIP